MATTPAKRACSVCGTLLADDSAYCPVCALQGAASPETESISAISSELRFEHYQVLRNQDGKPLELGHGGMGVTYKAIDTHLGCPVALKIISTQLLGNESARSRFLREARAAASVHHPNVATVHHLGESAGNYFYAMEFVDGETLESLIRRRGRLEMELALEIVTQVAAGLTAIHKQHLVHRDIKPSNIMLSWEEGRLENVKIIDLGLAKGVTEDTLSIAGSFVGTPTYASPEQFAGLGTDIRSDLYSLGVTLWEMLSGKPPFLGSAAELMGQHQHAVPPLEKLQEIPGPIMALLKVLLAKDPGQRFQDPAQLQHALAKVRGAIGSGLRLTPDELRSAGSAEVTPDASKRKPTKQSVRWALAGGLCFGAVLLAWVIFSGHARFLFNQRANEAVPTEKSVAVLPFESLSESKSDAYFADGVQDEILNNLAKIAQLKVISRTSVMQYRADTKRDLRQIATALGVANVLEGTVRRDGTHVRVSTELVDARNDNTIWADTYDRDLSDIFAIQSEVAQTIAAKLTAKLSPEEKQRIEAKPTNSLQAYDRYVQAKQLIAYIEANAPVGSYEKPSIDAIALLEQAVNLDPRFTLAYCALAKANDWLYNAYDPSVARRTLGDQAIGHAVGLQPELPEVHLASAHHLYVTYRDYEQARLQLTIARHGLPNDSEAALLEAFIDRRQGYFEKAVQRFDEAISLDPRNVAAISELGATFFMIRQFAACEREYDRAVDLAPDHSMFKVLKSEVALMKTADDATLSSALAALPASMKDDRGVMTYRLNLALYQRDWKQATAQIDRMGGGEDDMGFFGSTRPVPVGCYSILIARLEGKQPELDSSLTESRQQLSQKVQSSGGNAVLLSNLAIVDALLGKKEDGLAEAKRAVEILPISKDAMNGPTIMTHLAAVYAWTNEQNLAFETLEPLTKTPNGLYYGDLKLNPLWDPLRKDPRFDKLLAELVPRD